MKQRFKVIEFVNHSGSKSWRVVGYNRQGKQIRENYKDPKAAQCRQVELMADYLGRQPEDTSLRATTLTDAQLRIAEACFPRLDADDDMYLAVDLLLKHGKEQAAIESPKLDKAVEDFLLWLAQTETLRPRSKDKLRIRINLFCNSVPNVHVSDVSPEMIEKFLQKRNVSPLTKVGDREAISRFLSWCIARPRQWLKLNPCREIQIEKAHNGEPPAILSVEECRKLLDKAKKHRRGRLIPYVTACLFGGLRPAEAARLTWANVNLADGEIRVEAQSTKTKKPRVVGIDETMGAWLKAYENKPFHPANLRRDLEVIKQAAGYTGRGSKDQDLEGFKRWPPDVMRHTAISHFFRKSGSYGLTAEQFGNSESIIKNHYQGRVSSDDTAKFYALRPKTQKRRK